MRDPYAVLGVDRRASEPEIKAAFRRLAAQHHPDKNPDDPEASTRFKEANLAYQILSDPDKRAAYDRYGVAAFEPRAGNQRSGTGFVDLAGFDGVLGDLLEVLGVRQGEHGRLRRKLKVTFEEAALGCKKDVVYGRVDWCDRCHGQGGELGGLETPCPTCKGLGRQPVTSGLSFLSASRSCSRCRGSGRVPSTPCSICKGSGLRERECRVALQIPPGIESGSTRVIEQAGHRSRADRSPGDLEVLIEVGSHPYFRRADDNIVSSVSIAFTQATLGGEIEILTLDGPARVRIPPGTQPGSVLRLRGKGITRRLRAGRGDHLLEITIEVPKHLSSRAQELIEQLGHELGEQVHPQERSLLERLKNWFE